jgi:hypothetical protein
VYWPAARIGKTIGALEPPERAAAVPASRPVTSKSKRAPRAVVRWRLIKLRFALEVAHPNK